MSFRVSTLRWLENRHPIALLNYEYGGRYERLFLTPEEMRILRDKLSEIIDTPHALHEKETADAQA